MTADEKIAYQNLRIAMLEECIQDVRLLSLREPHSRGAAQAKPLWYELTLELIDRLEDKQDQARVVISQVRMVENDFTPPTLASIPPYTSALGPG